MINLNNLKKMCPLLILMHSNLFDPVPAKTTWSILAHLPLPPGRTTQPGVAGPFAGISGDALLIAGGANFPGKKPWEGGQKAYMDEVYILTKDQRWHTGFHLPQKLAYGASVTTPKGVLCIGGETPTGYSAKVFLLHWDGAIRLTNLPDLPTPLANAGATLLGHTVFVAGGENATQALAGFFALDLTRPTAWERLPDLPIALSHTVAVAVPANDHSTAAQAGAIYLIGGRSKTASGISTLHNTVFRFDPSSHQWRRRDPIPQLSNLAAANAIADDGFIFHRLETLNARLATADAASRENLQKEKLAIINDHPGFWRGILRYDPAHDHWTTIGELPVPAPVTTTAVRWGNTVVIPCGEIKPGIRSADILMGTLSPQRHDAAGQSTKAEHP
jgi:SSS family solute:Na+ symporter